MGSRLHPEGSKKHIVVREREWLTGEHDFHDSNERLSWKTFVGDMKRLLVRHPREHDTVKGAMLAEGFRLPLPDYSGAIQEATYVKRFLSFLGWNKRKLRPLSEVLKHGRFLRQRYLQEATALLDTLHNQRGYQRKRIIPQIRYRAGRLVYLASRQELASLAEQLRQHPELEFHAVVLMSVATGDVTQALRLGANVAQAVAQPLRAESRTASVQGAVEDPVGIQGLGVLALNGVQVLGAGPAPDNEFLRFARMGSDMRLMKSADPSIRELACLHGLTDQPRHPDMLDCAFDPAEDVVFDAICQEAYYHSGV